MDIVYVRGGDKDAPRIAALSGMHYGTRHDYTPYAAVWMLDIKWKEYDWLKYLALVRQYQPVMALAPDYEWSWQWTGLQRQIDDLRPLVKRVLVCPKWAGAIDHIPADCVIALSVPAPSYAGWLPDDLNQLSGRKVHLLGGSLRRQGDLLMRLNAVGADVTSIDGNTIAMKAGKGQCFSEGVWKQQRDKRSSNAELCETSAINYVKYLRECSKWKQAMLPMPQITVECES